MLKELFHEEGIEVWGLRARAGTPPEPDLSLLGEDERRRAEAMRRADQRAGYLAAHAALRELLGRRLGIHPAAVPFLRERCPRCGGNHGRPAVSSARAALHFSLSRRGEVALIAVARAPVGVDIEALPDAGTVAATASLLHPLERAELAAVSPSRRPALFARLWTRKEAYLKGVGVGLADDLRAEYVGAGERAGAPAGWRIVDLALPVRAGEFGDFEGAVAVEVGS